MVSKSRVADLSKRKKFEGFNYDIWHVKSNIIYERASENFDKSLRKATGW